MNPDDVRTMLEARRSELADELDELTATPRDPAATVSFGKRIGDGTAEAVERIAATSAARSLAAKAEEIDRALEKLDEDSYGHCDTCGGSIPAERLEAMPWATQCVGCASERPR